MSLLLRFFFIPLYKPKVGILLLINHKNKLRFSILIFLFLGIIYTLSVQLAYSRDIRPAVEPFFKIPVEDYYFYQRYWQILFFFLTTILFAGTLRLLSALLNGQGNFIDLFCIFCVSQTFPMFLTMWLPETILFVFYPGKIIKPVWLDVIRQVIGLIWPLALIVYSVIMIEKLKWYFSLILTLIAAIPIIRLMIIFVR